VEPGKVGIYCCGPTVYNYIHLGNARPLVVFDTVRRYFLWKGWDVTYVQNFTDVDDKIINRAKEENSDARSIAEKYIAAYFEDTKALNVLKADVHPQVTFHIEDIINTISAIMENGHAYEADAWFPNLEEDPDWVLTGESDEKTYFDLEFTFCRYERRTSDDTVPEKEA